MYEDLWFHELHIGRFGGELEIGPRFRKCKGGRFIQFQTPHSLRIFMVSNHIKHSEGNLMGGFNDIISSCEEDVIRFDGRIENKAIIHGCVKNPLEGPQRQTLDIIASPNVMVVTKKPRLKVAAIGRP